MPSIGSRNHADLLRRTQRDNRPALIPSLGAEVDDIVSGLNDFEVVLDCDNCISGIHNLLQNVDQPMYIGCVQPGGRFIQNINCFPGRTLGKLGR